MVISEYTSTSTGLLLYLHDRTTAVTRDMSLHPKQYAKLAHTPGTTRLASASARAAASHPVHRFHPNVLQSCPLRCGKSTYLSRAPADLWAAHQGMNPCWCR